MGLGFADNYEGVDDYAILMEDKIINGTEVVSSISSLSLFQGEINIPDSFTLVIGDSAGNE